MGIGIVINGKHIQEWTKEILWKTAFKKFEAIWSNETHHILSNFLKAAFHKVCLVQIFVSRAACTNSQCLHKISFQLLPIGLDVLLEADYA